MVGQCVAEVEAEEREKLGCCRPLLQEDEGADCGAAARDEAAAGVRPEKGPRDCGREEAETLPPAHGNG
eukprot:9416395-Pyramimonas_sp.AAC.1